MKKNDLFTARITGLTQEGSGVARCDGMAVFVPSAVVGDLLELRIVKVLSRYAFAIIEKILEPSPERIESDCPSDRLCGGCTFRHMTYVAELSAKENAVTDAFRRIGGLDPEFSPILASPSIEFYRNKAQLPVAPNEKGLADFGFYSKRSHRLVQCGDCLLQPSVFGAISRAVVDYCNDVGIAPYDEKSGSGVLRHIYLREARATGELMLCLVCTKKADFSGFIPQLQERFPMLKSVVLNINKQNTNVILGKESILLCGSEYITDELCGKLFRISPFSFYQVNPTQTERLYRLAAEFAGDGDELLDLYCGVGTIGISLSPRFKRLIGVEVISAAVENARSNAALNSLEDAEFICADAGQAAAELNKRGCRPEVIVLDPPRKGCDEATLAACASMSPERIVMISCNPATAARDCARLSALGYVCRRVAPVDMFPRTAHVESVVLMSRKDK